MFWIALSGIVSIIWHMTCEGLSNLTPSMSFTGSMGIRKGLDSSVELIPTQMNHAPLLVRICFDITSNGRACCLFQIDNLVLQ
ncbi:MAG: hypothetical protein WCC52_09230 [Nitrosotalea sp.]